MIRKIGADEGKPPETPTAHQSEIRDGVSIRLVMPAVTEMQSSDVNMQSTMLVSVVRSVLGSVSALKTRLIAVPVTVSVGLVSVVSPIAIVGIG